MSQRMEGNQSSETACEIGVTNKNLRSLGGIFIGRHIVFYRGEAISNRI